MNPDVNYVDYMYAVYQHQSNCVLMSDEWYSQNGKSISYMQNVFDFRKDVFGLKYQKIRETSSLCPNSFQ
jgi:hypothetical protein